MFLGYTLRQAQGALLVHNVEISTRFPILSTSYALLGF